VYLKSSTPASQSAAGGLWDSDFAKSFPGCRGAAGAEQEGRQNLGGKMIGVESKSHSRGALGRRGDNKTQRVRQRLMSVSQI